MDLYKRVWMNNLKRDVVYSNYTPQLDREERNKEKQHQQADIKKRITHILMPQFLCVWRQSKFEH